MPAKMWVMVNEASFLPHRRVQQEDSTVGGLQSLQREVPLDHTHCSINAIAGTVTLQSLRAFPFSLFPAFWPASQDIFCLFLLFLQANPAKTAKIDLL